MKVSLQIADERTADLLCAALEGGSNYWYCLVEGWPHRSTDNTLDYLTAVRDPELRVEIVDVEDDTPLGVITPESLQRGWELLSEQSPKHFAEANTEGQWDADTADVWLQYVVMGEIVYG